jgi:hypothetical protein
MKTYFTTLIASLTALLTPIKPLILMAFFAIVLDTYFGIWKTVRLKGWAGVRSRRLSDTITKSLLYVGAIIVIFLAEKYILFDVFQSYTSVEYMLTKLFTLFCLMTEVKSMSESYKEVTGKNLWRAFFMFVQRTRENRK